MKCFSSLLGYVLSIPATTLEMITTAKSATLNMTFGLPTICQFANIFFVNNTDDDLFIRGFEYAVPAGERLMVKTLAKRLIKFENETTLIEGFTERHYSRIITTGLMVLENWVFWGMYHKKSHDITTAIMRHLDKKLEEGQSTREVYDLNHSNYVKTFTLLDKLAFEIGDTMKKVSYEPYQIKDFSSPADKDWLERRNNDKRLVVFCLDYKLKAVVKDMSVDTILFFNEICFEFHLKKSCSICFQPFSGFGNNPYPFHLENTNPCCDRCNEREVIPARMRQVQERMNAEKEEQVKVAEAELLANPIVQEKPKQSKKDKKATQQELTRQANKANAQEKKRKEEFERQSAIAQAYKAEQQRKKQQAIARKKKEAQLKASQAILEKILEK